MTLTNTVVAKLAVAFVAISMVFFMVSPAKAETAEDLQATIDSLMAQIAALNAQLGSGSASSASVCPYTWTRSLSSGSTGADVKALQQFLNGSADTQVSASGAGSAGNETDYYGPATAAAVSKFQVAHQADILTPVGLVSPTGYFGPSTMAKANALCVASASDDEMDDEADDEMDDSDDESDDEGPVTLSGEASLSTASLDDASDDTMEEGADDAEAAVLSVEFVDGDAEISRIDVSFNTSAIGATVDPWDLLSEASLWVDGDKVASMDAGDRDEYQSDDMTLRFSGLSIVAMEDDELEITIAVNTHSSIDTADLGAVTVKVESLRFFDADDVATTESDPANPDTAVFTVEAAGVNDELIVKSSTSDPDATTLEVEDSAKSDWYNVFAFDLDTDDSENDIELTTLVVTVNTLATSTYNGLVDDAELVVDGVTINNPTVTNGTTNSATLTFDVDGDVVIDAGDRVKAVLMLRFKSLASGDEGATVQAEVTIANANAFEATGADDLNPTTPDQLRGSASGDTHTLRTSGVYVTDVTETATVSNNDTTPANSTASFVFNFTINAIGQDEVYVPLNAAISDSVNATQKGVVYRFEDANGAAVASTSLTSFSAIFQYVGGDGDTDTTGYLHLNPGDAADVKLSITMDPSAAGYYTAIMDSVDFKALSAAVADQVTSLSPETEYDSTTGSSVNN